MYQYKVYASGVENFCSPCYNSERAARNAFHKRYGIYGSEVRAVIINCMGYQFISEKLEGHKSFRHI